MVPDEVDGVPIEAIVPDLDPAELGVEATGADVSGLTALYDHGMAKGRVFIF